MKKTLIIIALTFAVAVSSLGAVATVNAQEIIEECEIVRPMSYNGENYTEGQTVQISDDDGAGGIVCLINTVNRVAQLVFYLMVALIVAFVIAGGFLVLTSGGSEDKVNKGKNLITYALAGIFIAVFAYAVPYVVSFILG